MSYLITYCSPFEAFRIIQGVMIDSRVQLGLIGKNGNELQPLIDAEVAKITDGVILYKIERDDYGTLAGYVILQVSPDGKTVTILQQVIRPSFQYDINNINSVIKSFIINNNWNGDYLQ